MSMFGAMLIFKGYVIVAGLFQNSQNAYKYLTDDGEKTFIIYSGQLQMHK